MLLLLFLLIPSAVQSFVVKTTNTFATHNTVRLMATKTHHCDVAVFGGGFGGLYTALALSRESQRRGKSLDVVLVDPSEQFVFLPLLYDLTVGTATTTEVCPYYKDILPGTGVRHIRASFDQFSSPNFLSANLLHNNSTNSLSFRSSVVAVGSTPESSLATVPGASEFAQPFYTQNDAVETQQLLEQLEVSVRNGEEPRCAVIGGGYGGVELAACVKRRIPKCQVTLLSRGPPMQGTRAEALVEKALQKLGVTIELCSVQEIVPFQNTSDSLIIKRQGEADLEIDDSIPWDAVLWTAGSGVAQPVSEGIDGLSKADSGRLAIDVTLRCIQEDPSKMPTPLVWALGDCAEILGETGQPAVPKTAQAAMQQADIVANNILAELQILKSVKKFQYQDLGSMLTLGGATAAISAPIDDSPLAPIFKPFLDTARVGLGFADEALVQLGKSPVVERAGLTPVVESMESLGLSLGGYGLGVDTDVAPGTLAGTISGAARRAVYAARMPTNRQRVYAAASAAFSTANTIAQEAFEQMEENKVDE